MESRRAFLRMSVFGIAAASVAGGVAVSAGSSGAPVAPIGSAPDWRFAPVRAGDEIGLGWSLVRIFPAVQGAVTLTLAHADGRAARVDVCLREGAPRGPASTENLDFIVMDGGDGAGRTDESLGRVVRRLAAMAARNEEQDVASLAALEPHADRVWRHADALAVAARQLEPGTPLSGGDA
jgi:hypothetical protein